jgi:hypothetical protein
MGLGSTYRKTLRGNDTPQNSTQTTALLGVTVV